MSTHRIALANLQSGRPRSVTKNWRLDGVDLLRGLAILFVLMNHVNMQLRFARVLYTNGLPQQLVSSLVWNGQYGVQMFFAISGFLITSTTIRRWGSLAGVRPGEFYLLRFARIAPLLLLLLAMLSVLHLGGVSPFVIRAKTGGLGSALVAALTFRINVLEATRGYLPGNWDILWSLSVEETFYLLFPLAATLLGRGKLLVAVLISLVLLGPFARALFTGGSEVWHEYSYLGAMDAVALGCLTAILTARRELSRRQLVISGIVWAAFVFFILGFSISVGALGFTRAGLDMTILAIGTCMIIVVAAKTQWKRPRLLAPLTWIGERSYEVYFNPHVHRDCRVHGVLAFQKTARRSSTTLWNRHSALGNLWRFCGQTLFRTDEQIAAKPFWVGGPHCS